MKKNIVSFISGVVFATGLVISGMTNPEKVKGFLDIFGAWDPTLAFVMLGAISFNLFSFRKILKSRPLYDKKHFLPSKKNIDLPLFFGAAIFGLGWGLLGICPGPGIVNLVMLTPNTLYFVLSMTLGMAIYRILLRLNK